MLAGGILEHGGPSEGRDHDPGADPEHQQAVEVAEHAVLAAAWAGADPFPLLHR